ncbi:hypothetical protein OPV22_023288 [Ensete ventricosum]|uniref:Uncharacterized protein n=1 Tax=Ensete ventricosum TaxID=4639 RepID=A0AAV8QLT8_ENSVE|nr:hypothetical protein OPV22_023288 [Ensete ventricosum]
MEARGDRRKNKNGVEEIENGIWARRWDLDQRIDQKRSMAWKSPERRGPGSQIFHKTFSSSGGLNVTNQKGR